MDDGGLAPTKDESSGEENEMPAIPAGKDDGLVFDVLALYTNGFAEAYPEAMSLLHKSVTWQVWQTPPMQTARSALLHGLSDSKRLIILTVGRWKMPLIT